MRRTATQPTRVSRRAVLLVVFAICALGSRIATASDKNDSEMHVVLLGTGYPRPDADRAGPSTAVVLGEKLFVVDTGRGVMMRMTAAHLPAENLQAVFLTHLHSDHISGLPDLFTTTWIINRRAAPLELYGPRGTKDTGPSANLVAHSHGADILVHEACLPESFDVHDSPAVAARLKRYHSTPEQSGADAQEASVKLLVLTHLVPGNVAENPHNAFLQRARKTFRGKIIVGRDLMKF